jgi:hypothetical protein
MRPMEAQPEVGVPEELGLEQRRSPRVDIFREIACEADGVACRSQVADLSVGGMFIDLARPPFRGGTRLRVCFTIHDGEPPILASAVVHYVQDGIGMGIRFEDLWPADRERIAAFVADAPRRQGMAPPVRKSARVWVQVPVRLRGTRSDGPAFEEHARIVTLSKHGACLESGQPIEVGTKLAIETPRGRAFRGNVVWVGSEASRSVGQVGIQCRGLAQELGFQFP